MLILIILTPEGLNLAWFRAFWYIVRQDPFRGLGEGKKGICMYVCMEHAKNYEIICKIKVTQHVFNSDCLSKNI